jgi:drug/metabolite transporter (DMT)-like permease
MASSERLTGAALVTIAAIAFSGKAVIIKLAYRHGVDPVTLLTLRMLISAPFFLALGLWAARGDAQPLTPADWRSVVVLGLMGYYLASLFDFLGLQYITAALERLVLFLYPTFVLLLAALFFGRSVTRRDLLALALSYGGIVLVFANDFSLQGANVVLGSFWVLLSALFYAGYLLGSGRMVGRLGSLRFACYAALVSCVGIVAHFLAFSDAALLWTQPAPVYWLSLLMALVSTVIPIVLTAEGIRRIGSSHAAMIGAAGPVSTILFGSWFLDEAITAIQLAGAALVLAGVLAISLQKTKAGSADGRR